MTRLPQRRTLQPARHTNDDRRPILGIVTLTLCTVLTGCASSLPFMQGGCGSDGCTCGAGESGGGEGWNLSRTESGTDAPPPVPAEATTSGELIHLEDELIAVRSDQTVARQELAEARRQIVELQARLDELHDQFSQSEAFHSDSALSQSGLRSDVITIADKLTRVNEGVTALAQRQNAQDQLLLDVLDALEMTTEEVMRLQGMNGIPRGQGLENATPSALGAAYRSASQNRTISPTDTRQSIPTLSISNRP